MTFPAAQRPGPRRFRFLRSFSALILREMSTTYGRSPGGYLWAILEPVGGLAVLSIVFSFIIRAPSLGNNFPYFFAGGLLTFTLYMQASANVAGAIRFSRPLLEYPAVSFMDALLARFALNIMTNILVIFIVITGVIVMYSLTPILRWPSIFLALSMAAAMGFGVGVMNCFLFSRFPLWERVWAVVTRPAFILSGVFYIPEDLPTLVRPYMMYNPLLHVTSEMRKGMFATYDAVHVQPAYVFGTAIVLTILGLLFLRRYHKDLMLV